MISKNINKKTSWEDIRALYKAGITDVSFSLSDGKVITADDAEAIDESLRSALHNKDYQTVKELNRACLIFSYLNKEASLRSYPVEIQLESTSFCNSECIMCGHYVYRNVISQNMSEKMIAIMDEYLPYLETIILHGNGEPFLEPGLDKLILHYASYGIKLVTNTNLSYLPDKILDLIPDNFNEISVSIDGCTKEIYEGIRINLSFEKLIENLGRLNEAAPSLPKKMAVVVMRQNLEQVPDFIDFAAEHGFMGVNFIAMGSSPVAGNFLDEPWVYPNLFKAKMKEAYERADRLGIEIELPMSPDSFADIDEAAIDKEIERIHKRPFFEGEEIREKLFEEKVRPRLDALNEAEKLHPTSCKGHGINYSDYLTTRLDADSCNNCMSGSCIGGCDSMLFRPFINLDGKVFACCVHTKEYAGDLLRGESLMEIWNGEQFRNLRTQMYEGRIPFYCRSCSFIQNQFLKLGEFNG